MKCMADLCVIPIGQSVSVADEIAECQRVLQQYPVETALHAYGTGLAGEWEDVFAAIRACHERLHETGVVRISSTIKVGTRTDREQSFGDKIQAVRERLQSDDQSDDPGPTDVSSPTCYEGHRE